jgi:hypothetical protein
VAASPRWQASTSFTWCGSRLRTGASASSPRGGLAGQGSSTGAGANGGASRQAVCGGRPRICAAVALASRRPGSRGCLVQPAPCRPCETGPARRPVVDRRDRRGARARAPLPTGRTHQADRPGPGTAAAGSGERGKPPEPASSEASRRTTTWTRAPARRRPVQRSDAARPSRWVVAL